MKYKDIIALDPGFKPKFGRFDSVQECADSINKPHPDYPLLVDSTEAEIAALIDLKDGGLSSWNLRQIHSFIGRHLLHDQNQIGQYRSHEVSVVHPETGKVKHRPPSPDRIHDLIDSIMPVIPTDNLEEWYTAFQIIHPFSDGNGRVGGIVYTAMKYAQCGLWFAPKQ